MEGMAMPDNGKPNLTRGEKYFVGGASLFFFVVPLPFAVATIGWGYGFPAVIAAFSLGLCAAAIAYAFLGGVAAAEFTAISGVKLAGSVAVIAIIYYLVSGPLDKNMRDDQAIATGKTAAATIRDVRNELDAANDARDKAEDQVRQLQAKAGMSRADSDAAILARVEQSSPSDSLGRGIIAMYRNHRGPFERPTIKLQARFLQDVPKGTFRFCHDKRDDIAGRQVDFEIVDPEDGTSRKISLSAGGDIGPGACSVIKFDVQLGCDAAKSLLQVDCDEQRGVAWTAASDNKIYELVATIANPDSSEE